MQRVVENDKAECASVAVQWGSDYWDGDRKYGYGGYKYDGRWVSVAKDMIVHLGLRPGDRVLDIGCAKGFLMKDLMDALSGLQVFGVDISEYALMNCHPDVIGRIHLGSADHLPFPDGSFQAVICLDTIHNLPRERGKIALQEIQRLSDGNAYVRVDSYRTPAQKVIFESWVLTAEFHDYPDEWIALFNEAGYNGDYSWTIIE